ncbi:MULTISPECIES: DUF899 family protein [Amycolatopsis]|uniref:DUF899 family protein n=1 Tax=Amycolatopsis TaxID=1813 RepID=UPI001E295BD3|nr:MULTISPECIES: DUF899 family protein [Amycolatopsis]
MPRAPLEKIEAYQAKKGWRFPWYSSHGSDFNHDFGVTLDGSSTYNYRTKEEWEEPKGRAAAVRAARPGFPA